MEFLFKNKYTIAEENSQYQQDKSTERIAAAEKSFRTLILNQYDLEDDFVSAICGFFRTSFRALKEGMAAPKECELNTQSIRLSNLVSNTTDSLDSVLNERIQELEAQLAKANTEFRELKSLHDSTKSAIMKTLQSLLG